MNQMIPFVRDILTISRAARAQLAKPEIPEKATMPISIETREPDPTIVADIQQVDPLALSVTVDHPELFQPGDSVMVVQRRSHEILSPTCTVLEIRGNVIYLDADIQPHQLLALNIGDLLSKQKTPSIVLSYPDITIPHHSKQEVEQIREAFRDEPIAPPDPRIVRTPGQRPRGIKSFHIPLPDSPIPEGLTTIPIEFDNGQIARASLPGWLLRNLIEEDLAFLGRWRHWGEQETQPGKQIPFIQFDEPDARTMERINRCLEIIDPAAPMAIATIDQFFDWLLWSLGHPGFEFPQNFYGTRIHDCLCQVFNPGRLSLYPADYFGALTSCYSALQSLPINEANNLVRSIFPGRRNDYRADLLIDPQGNTSVLMAASNLTYQYTAMTASPLMAKAMLLTAYWYAPWLIFPIGSQEDPSVGDAVGRSLPLMQRRHLPPDYLGAVELHPDFHQYLPVILVQSKAPAIKLFDNLAPASPTIPLPSSSIGPPLPAQRLPGIKPALQPLQPLPQEFPLPLPAEIKPSERLQLPGADD